MPRSRAIDLRPSERLNILEHLRYRQQRRKEVVKLSDADKAQLRAHVLRLRTRSALSPGSIRNADVDQIIVSATPGLDWSKRQEAEKYVREVYDLELRKTGAMPVKRYRKETLKQLRSRGLSAHDAAMVLEAAVAEDPVREFQVRQAEESRNEPDCEDCNKHFGGFHFHSWDECPLNPEND